jgi:tetratricopeptide (TPR) repeat protein
LYEHGKEAIMVYQSGLGGIAHIALLMVVLCGIPTNGVAQDDFRDVVRSATPGVVTIMVFDSTGRPLGQGSGFFIDAEHIITSRHVIEGGDRAEFRLSNGKVFAIDGVNADDPRADLASLSVRVPLGEAHPLPLAETSVEVGEGVLAIGTPLGFELTVSNGIVSSRRTLPGVGVMLQITAPVSHGSSGGPVLNRRGEVVGVTTSVIDKGQNLNFATPVEGIRTLKNGPSKPLAQWRQMQKGHAAVAIASPELAEVMRDPVEAAFLSDYAFSRGRAYMENRNLDQAVEMFMTAARLQPTRGDAYYQAGMCELMMRHPEHAIEAFTRGVEAAPKHINMWYQLGRMQAAVQKLKEAETSLHEALRLDSTFAPAWFELGSTYAGMHNDSAGIRCFQKSLQLNPENFEAHMNLGIILANRGGFSEAAPEFLEAHRIDSASPAAKASLGSVYNKLERFKEAVPLLESAVAQIATDSELRGEYGVALLGVGRCADAQREFSASLQMNPNNAFTHYSMGNAYVCLKKGDAAIDAFTEAIRLEPDNPLPHYSLGMAYSTLKNDKAKALGEYKILQGLDPKGARALFNVIYEK